MESNKVLRSHQDNIVRMLMFRFFPYWPLFFFLIITSIVGAFIYLKFATPIYETSATLIVKDEKKGYSDVKLIEYADAFTTKKIVENEVEVLRSKALMKQVVNKFYLYAPIYKRGRFKYRAGYISSPVVAEVKEPDLINAGMETAELKFSVNVNSDKKQVYINGNYYKLDDWIKTNFATFRFRSNPNYDNSSAGTDEFLITFINPRIVAADLVSNLSVEPVSKVSSVINLYYYDEVPQRAEHILNELLELYNQASINNKNILADNTLRFVDDRINIIEKGLDSIETRIEAFKSRKGIVNLSEQGSLFLKNVSENDQRIASISMQLAALDEVEKYVISKEDKTGIVPSTLGVNDLVLSQLLQKLYDAEIQVEKVKKSTGAGDNNPIVVSLTNEIQKIRPSILENITNQRVSLLSTRSNLSTSNNIYSSVLQGIPKKEQEMLDITRQQSIKTNVYNFLLQKREETALTQASAVSDSGIIDLAQTSSAPVTPKRNIIFFTAIIIATLVGGLYVLCKEGLNNKILFRSEIEELTQVPIAAEITNIRYRKFAVIAGPKRPFIAEQFRKLRAAIGIYGNKKINRTILVTSSIAGEGKSFVCTNIALSLALAGKKVIIIDLDLRNPTTSKMLLGEYEKPGVAEFLEGNLEPHELIEATEYENLYLMPAGNCFTNATELFLNGDLNTLFNFLKASFDYVIVDTSPIDFVTDAYVLSEFCDTTLFVIRHSYTPKTFVQLLDENDKVKALKNLHIVFNGVKSRGFVMGAKGFGYGQGYGYDYVYRQDLLKKIDNNRSVFLQKLVHSSNKNDAI